MHYIILFVLLLSACTTPSTPPLPTKAVTVDQLVKPLNIPPEKSIKYKDEKEVLLAIRRKVQNHWVLPQAYVKDLKCSVNITLKPSGDISDLRITTSSGNDDFDTSVITALQKAAPLPTPIDAELYEKRFKNFSFVFNPKN